MWAHSHYLLHIKAEYHISGVLVGTIRKGNEDTTGREKNPSRRVNNNGHIKDGCHLQWSNLRRRHTTLLRRWNNVIDVDSTSQQRHVPSVSGHIKGWCHLQWSNSRRGPTEMPIVSKKPLIIQCCLKSRWASVAEGYPLSKQHLVNVSCFLGRRFAGQCQIRPKTTRLEGGIKVFYVSSY